MRKEGGKRQKPLPIPRKERVTNSRPRLTRRWGNWLFKCRYRDVPVGDCIIAATATIKRSKVLSDDPHFDAIKEVKGVWI